MKFTRLVTVHLARNQWQASVEPQLSTTGF